MSGLRRRLPLAHPKCPNDARAFWKNTKDAGASIWEQDSFSALPWPRPGGFWDILPCIFHGSGLPSIRGDQAVAVLAHHGLIFVQQPALKPAQGPISLADILTLERVRCGAQASSKKKALEMLSELMAGAEAAPDSRAVADRLLAREKLGSTALGHGVAIPHGRCPDVTTAVAAFIKLREGIDFDAPDGESVDLVVGLLVPQECTDGHLQLLAQLAELFSQAEIREKLRTSVSPADVVDILSSSTHHV